MSKLDAFVLLSGIICAVFLLRPFLRPFFNRSLDWCKSIVSAISTLRTLSQMMNATYTCGKCGGEMEYFQDNEDHIWDCRNCSRHFIMKISYKR